MRAVLLALLSVAWSVGCLVAPDEARIPPTASGGHVLSGAFTHNATPQDIEEARRLAQQENVSLAVMESFPSQFTVHDLDIEGCNRLRDALLEKEYVGRVSDCLFYNTRDAQDAPTTNATPTVP